MPEVTDAEIVAMVRAMNAPLAAVLQRAFDESAGGEYRAGVEAILSVFDDDLPMTAAILDEDPGQLTAEAAALVRIREIGRTVLEGRWPTPAKPPAKVPDTTPAGGGERDWDLLVTVRVYGGDEQPGMPLEHMVAWDRVVGKADR